MKKSKKYDWPGINFTKYKIRVLHALNQEERNCKELKRISGYSGYPSQVEKNILEEALNFNLVSSTGSGVYCLTSKGEWVLDHLMDYRDLQVYDMRKNDSKKRKEA